MSVHVMAEKIATYLSSLSKTQRKVLHTSLKQTRYVVSFEIALCILHFGLNISVIIIEFLCDFLKSDENSMACFSTAFENWTQ